jgi:hypothetical protein
VGSDRTAVAFSTRANSHYVSDNIERFRPVCNPLDILDSSMHAYTTFCLPPCLSDHTHNCVSMPHARAASATSASSTSSALSTTAPHTARAALRCDALRNRATVRNRGTCVSAPMNSLAAAGGAAGESTRDGRSAGSSEARKAAAGSASPAVPVTMDRSNASFSLVTDLSQTECCDLREALSLTHPVRRKGWEKMGR